MSIAAVTAECKAIESTLTTAELADARWECSVPMFEGAVSWCSIGSAGASRYLVELRSVAAGKRAAARMEIYRTQGIAAFRASA